MVRNNDDSLSTGEARTLRVLVVDDDPEVREILGFYVARQGHDVYCAADGREALYEFRQGSFDLVVTDQWLPGLNGNELAQAIKKSSPQTPIVMITGDQGYKAPPHVDFLLAKPLTWDAVGDAVGRAMWVA